MESVEAKGLVSYVPNIIMPPTFMCLCRHKLIRPPNHSQMLSQMLSQLLLRILADKCVELCFGGPAKVICVEDWPNMMRCVEESH